MKRLIIILFFSFVLFSVNDLSKFNVYADEKLVSFPLSLSYNSIYWWRGGELNGKGVGVFWPGAGVVFESLGIELGIVAGISEDILSVEKHSSSNDVSPYKNAEKAKTEIDYGISYSIDLSEMISFGAGAMFVHYPYYDADVSNAINPSFYEFSFSVGVNALLSPTVDLYYDLYVKEISTEMTAEQQAIYQSLGFSNALMTYQSNNDNKTPTSEDFYISFSISHDLINTDDGFSFSFSGLIGYYNNAYLDLKGWSDYVITASISKEYENLSFEGGLNYGRSLDRDFETDDMKNHFWCDFGVTYTML